jgi:hypothetical protein
MTNIFILLGGILLFATVIVVLDEIRRRRARGRSQFPAEPGARSEGILAKR